MTKLTEAQRVSANPQKGNDHVKNTLKATLVAGAGAAAIAAALSGAGSANAS